MHAGHTHKAALSGTDKPPSDVDVSTAHEARVLTALQVKRSFFIGARWATLSSG